MKLAMIEVDAYIKENYETDNVAMLLQAHEEVILEITDEHVKKVSADLKEIMEGVYKLSVPLVVDDASGQNWGEL